MHEIEKWLREENLRLRELLRESLNVTGDGVWHRRVYAALGEEPPPLRKLKGKVPMYQRETIPPPHNTTPSRTEGQQ